MSTRVLAQRYEIYDKIGEGGMAVVFKAKDRKLDRYVALKILRPEYTKDDSFIESFHRESQLVAGIVDPNIIQVYDVGQQGNIYYIVMELVEGETLSEIISREGALDAKTTVSYARQIAMALTTAHSNHLIHRDIKPHNIMVTYDGVAKLTDFGIAKRVNNNTLVGDEKEAVMGSIHYFSPEQARGNKVDERSDIYSLGIVMYEMITGKVPYDGDNAVEVAVKHMNGQMEPPSHLVPEMPQDLEDVILKATAKSADSRYKNAEEMITDLNFVKFSRKSDYGLEMDDRKAHPEKYAEPGNDSLSEESSSAGTRVGAAQLQNEKNAGKRKLMIAVGAFLAAALLIFGLFRLVLGGNADNNTVIVPKIEGSTYEEAKILLESMDLKIVIETELVNDNEDVGTIVRQSPSEGSSAKKGQTVKVNITRKSTAPTVPPLVNLELNSATARLQQYGYILGEVSEEYSDTVEKGKVVSCSPVVGSALDKGSKIDLVVSKGPDPASASKFAIDVRGKSLEEAIALIERMGCSVPEKKIKYTENDSVEPGCVCAQSPAYNEKVAQGTEFSLTVRSTGTEEGEAVLAVDFRSFEGESFSVTVIVTDDFKNTKDGTTQHSKVSVNRADLTDGSTYSFPITGTGKGTAIVIVDNNTPIAYAVNFSDGTVVLQ